RFMADVNGDGKADYCRFVGNAPNIFLSCALSTGTGFGQYDVNGQQGFDAGYANMPRFMADVNGDGKADYCRFVGNAPNIFLSCALSTGTGFGQYDVNGRQGFDAGYGNMPRFLSSVTN
ncbi:MAG: VCBS repeat-containing protein, partial [Xanthobacteraceae bacterium]